MTRIAIVGSREFGTNRDGTKNKAAWALLEAVFVGLMKKYGRFTLVSGGAKGADSMAEWMANNRFHLDTRVFCLHDSCDPAKGHEVQDYRWERVLPNGTRIPQKDAGFKRNAVIVENADLIVAFLHPESKGTRHTVHLAQDAGKPVHLFTAFPDGSAADRERLPGCPCEDAETHKRIKNAQVYATVTLDGRDEVLDGGDTNCSCQRLPHYHTVAQHPENVREADDFTFALELESECQTCGEAMADPFEGCRKCAGDDGMFERVVLEESDPDKTGQNYFLKTIKVRDYEAEAKRKAEHKKFEKQYKVIDLNTYQPQMRDPWMGATTKRLVNGYWVWTRKDGVVRPQSELDAAIAKAQSLPQGKCVLA